MHPTDIMDWLRLFLAFYMFSFSLYANLVEGRVMQNNEAVNKFFSKDESDLNSTKWAVLVAASHDYQNYRHQADVCHAYQLLKRKGLADENIIVFMYDDIAYHYRNPKKGFIINRPNGPNVYDGVPLDYTGYDVSPQNFFAVLFGNEKGISGGSGKVLKTGPDDQIFLYWSGHGALNLLAMPGSQIILARDLVDALVKKAASDSFDAMLIYVESCYSGSMFKTLPTNLDIYVTTAANPHENSYSTYCNVEKVYDDVCLGDEYSISWLEDSEQSELREETLGQQYEKVKKRTTSSHVMKYGNTKMDAELLALFFHRDFDFMEDKQADEEPITVSTPPDFSGLEYDQQAASLQSLMLAVWNAPNGTLEQKLAQKVLDQELADRRHADCVIEQIAKAISSPDDYLWLIDTFPDGVDDWNCFSTLVSTYQTYCGGFSMYGIKYGNVFANMCSNGTQEAQLAEIASEVCGEGGKC